MSKRRGDGRTKTGAQVKTPLTSADAFLGTYNVHHVRKLADLGPPGPAQPTWATIMTRRRRKTLVVCAACHDHIHTGQPTRPCVPEPESEQFSVALSDIKINYRRTSGEIKNEGAKLAG